MMRIEATPQGRMRVIGVLEGAALRGFLETRSDTEVLLDLSEVREADATAVRTLARLPSGRCRLVECPRWLALWIEQERQAQTSNIVAP